MYKFLVLLYLFISILNGSEINDLVSQIKQAPTSQKRVLINQLKLLLRNSNNTQRLNVVNKLKGTHYSTQHTNKMKINIVNKSHTKQSNQIKNNSHSKIKQTNKIHNNTKGKKH
jgi:hypothetical protein